MARSFGIFLGLLSALPGLARSRPAEYAVVLADPPLADAFPRAALGTAPARTKLTRIQAAQNGVRAELARRNIPVAGAVQLLANAVFVRVSPERAFELRSIPGVARVQRMPRLKRHLDTALDLVGAAQAWTSLGGPDNAGAGIKIGIIDSGIDQTHPGFQDASLQVPAGFPKGDANYTNSKVIVARSYVSYLAGTDPATSRPDDLTPRDRVGHGTAIAMIAAGVRNGGPRAAIQGVAPKAWLGNYKIFGSPGVNDYTFYSAMAAALDDAYRDGMDIVTLSLGEGDPAVSGPLDQDTSCSSDGTTLAYCDVRAQLIENAVKNNLVVVASAGNDGATGLQYPTLNSIHTPGTAPSAITVGATTNAHLLFASVTPQGGSPMDAIFGIGGRTGGPLTARLADVAQVGSDDLACAPLPDGSLAGVVALVRRGTCVFSDKIYFAQSAGAVAVIIYQPAGTDYPVEIDARDVGIPSMGVGYTDGTTLKSLAAGNVNVTLDPALHAKDAPDANTVIYFSSRGPALGTLGIKPEVAAVGTDLYTATQKFDSNGDIYDATGYTTATGTSYAVGMVAGTAALVKQRFPSLTAAQIKSAVVNTATQDVAGDNGRARVNDAGAGKLYVANAVNAAAVAEPATLSFGSLGTGSLPLNRTLNLTNIGSSNATFSFTVNQRDPDPRGSVRMSPSSLTLQPGQKSSVTVSLSGTRPNAGSYEGFIDITGAGSALHVPYEYIVSDGVVYNAFPVINGSFVGVAGDQDWILGLRVTDRYGVPVPNAAVRWGVVAGGGSIYQADATTDVNGLAAADVDLGSQQGDQIFTGTVAGQVVEFDGFAGLQPVITRVVDSTGAVPGNGFAPGAQIAIIGNGLATTTARARAGTLLSLATVSVSFDAPGVSVPGQLISVSPGEVDVQIPQELKGQASAQIKVSILDISSPLFTLPLAQ